MEINKFFLILERGKKKVLRVLLVFGSLASEYVEMSMRRQK